MSCLAVRSLRSVGEDHRGRQRSQKQGVERGAVAPADDHDRAARKVVRVAFQVIGDISAEGAVGRDREAFGGWCQSR